MITVLLVGFHYAVNVLPVVTIDLYRAHRYFKDLTTDITYITDMKTIAYPSNMLALAEAEEIKDDIASFLETDRRKYAFSREDFVKAIGEGDRQHVVVYFSGHGIDGNLLLPDGSQLSALTFRSILIKAYPKAAFFIVTDCCNATGLSLPYQLEGNHFTLAEYAVFSENRILLMTSSSTDEKAVSDMAGSYFTKYLFSLLEAIRRGERKASLPALLKDIDGAIHTHKSGYKQTIGLYASQPFKPILWSWLWLNIDVELLELLGCLKVTSV